MIWLHRYGGEVQERIVQRILICMHLCGTKNLQSSSLLLSIRVGRHDIESALGRTGRRLSILVTLLDYAHERVE